MITYRELAAEDMEISVFSRFDRTQIVTKCWRKEEGAWVIRDDPFVDAWTEEDCKEKVRLLRDLITRGGYVAGAFQDGYLKGFVSVEPALFGSRNQYMDMSRLHVSRDMRRSGIGRELFGMAKKWAKAHRAEKLYISAHSAVESQAFYISMGCVDAVEYNAQIAAHEPCDRQMEYTL